MIAAADLRKIDATPTDLPDAGRMGEILDDAITMALLGVKTPAQAIEDAAAEWQKSSTRIAKEHPDSPLADVWYGAVIW